MPCPQQGKIKRNSLTSLGLLPYSCKKSGQSYQSALTGADCSVDCGADCSTVGADVAPGVVVRFGAEVGVV